MNPALPPTPHTYHLSQQTVDETNSQTLSQCTNISLQLLTTDYSLPLNLTTNKPTKVSQKFCNILIVHANLWCDQISSSHERYLL